MVLYICYYIAEHIADAWTKYHQYNQHNNEYEYQNQGVFNHSLAHFTHGKSHRPPPFNEILSACVNYRFGRMIDNLFYCPLY